jgi:hypothetical protein
MAEDRAVQTVAQPGPAFQKTESTFLLTQYKQKFKSIKGLVSEFVA